MNRIVLDALRENREGLDVDRLAAIVIEREGFDCRPRDRGNRPPALHDGDVPLCG